MPSSDGEAEALSCPDCGTLHALTEDGSLFEATVDVKPDDARLQQTVIYSPEDDDTAADDTAATEATVDYHVSVNATERLPGQKGEAPAAGQDHVGRFTVQSILGRGAFGTVYRAFDPVLDREVALKVPRFAEDDPALHERFLREAKSAARLRHPNIVAVFESGQTDRDPYIASEFVDGIPLSSVLRNDPPDTRTAVDWVRQIAEGIHYAHTEGIIHRDIKPANIMVSKGGRPQIMDFGLAKRSADNSAMTMEGQIIGTPAYMAPEQARGDREGVGPQADQYSVGVVLYEMLCGRTPFVGGVWKIMGEVVDPTELPPSPSSLRDGVSPDLEACCLKSLEKDPDDRYATLDDFAQDLERWLEGRSVTARPIGPAERLVRWCRRNRVVASLSGTLLVILLAAAIIGPLLAVEFQSLAEQATKDAEAAEKARGEEKVAKDRAQDEQAKAELARADAEEARRDTEKMLIDNFTETGLAAHAEGDAPRALLWFANAAAQSEQHPLREQHNRVRFESWASEVAIPFLAFETSRAWSEALRYHPSGRYLMTESADLVVEIRDLATGDILPFPVSGPIGTAVWNSDGSELLVASGQDLVQFSFPAGEELQRWRHDSPIGVATFSADDRWIAIGNDTGAKVLSADGSREILLSPELNEKIETVTFNAGGTLLATTSAATPVPGRSPLSDNGTLADGKTRVYSIGSDAEPVQLLNPLQPWHLERPGATPRFLSGGRLLTVESQKAIRCVDVATGDLQWEHPIRKCTNFDVSPDGSLVAVGSQYEVLLLDSQTGERIDCSIRHRNFVYGVAFHPDGKSLLSCSADSTARVTHVPSGEPEIQSIPHNDFVHRSVWSPDGSSFATIHWDGQLVRVWKRGGGVNSDFAVTLPDQQPFLREDLSGRRLIPAGFDTRRTRREVRVLDSTTGEVTTELPEQPGLISDLAVIGQGRTLVLAGSKDADTEEDVRKQNLNGPGVVRFVDAGNGAEVWPTLETPSAPIAVKVSPDEAVVVVLCHGGQLLLIDGADGSLNADVVCLDGKPGDYGWMIRDRLRFHPDGKRFAVWGSGQAIEVRNADDCSLVTTVRHYGSYVHDVRFSPDGRRFVSCGSQSDTVVRQWDVETGEPAWPVLQHSDWVFCAQFSADGKRLLTASRDRQVRLWDLETASIVCSTIELPDEVYAVCFAPGERYFLAGLRNGAVGVWDSRFGRPVAPSRVACEHIYDLALNRDQTHVLVSGRVNQLLGYDIDSWVREPAGGPPREDLRLLGEVLSGQRLNETGTPTGLTTVEWFDRWNRFRAAHPGSPFLELPAIARLQSEDEEILND